MALSTADFLLAVRRRAMLPATVGRGMEDSDLLAFANEELQTHMQSLLSRVNGERDVSVIDYQVVPGQARYRIPDIASGDSIRDIQIREGNEYHSLEPIEPERANWDVQGYYFEGNHVVLTPTPHTAGFLRIKVYRRLPKLVATLTESFTPTSISTSGAISPLAIAPAGFYDLTEGGDYLATGIWVSAASAICYAYTATARAPDPFLVNYPYGPTTRLQKSSETVFVPVPESLEPILIVRTAHATLEALGNPKAEVLSKRAAELEEKVLSVLQPRSQGKAQAIINKNGPGFSSGSRSYWRR